MKYLLSYLEVPQDYQLKNWDSGKLKDNMWMTAKPLYKTIKLEFKSLINIVKSDYRQYSSFEFKDGLKQSDNWSNDNQDLIILDIDDGLTLNEAKGIFSDFTYLMATTKAHQVGKKGLQCDRFRIIMPSSDIPKGDDYFNFMRMMEKKYPFIDEQVNTKTGAFLGFAGCEYWFNDGYDFNCGSIVKMMNRLNKSKLQETKIPQKKPMINYQSSEDIDVLSIKSRLTREVVADIVSSCGFDINRKFMFKYRADERTPSASISPDLLIKDFGSDLSTDAIGFVMETKQMTFIEATNYVEQFTGR